jgi:hypothetical protein
MVVVIKICIIYLGGRLLLQKWPYRREVTYRVIASDIRRNLIYVTDIM